MTIQIFDSDEDRTGKTFGFAVVSGLRSHYYVKRVLHGVPTVGAMLQPGVSRALFDVPAEELAERHVAVEDLWGSNSLDIRSQLLEINSLQQRLDIFESFLVSKLPEDADVHPAVMYALSQLSPVADIGRIVMETGYSHKHFIELFRSFVGLSPRLYCRLLRLQEVLKSIDGSNSRWIQIAAEHGYSDQAHFNREFREFTGLSPGEYRNLRINSHRVLIR